MLVGRQRDVVSAWCYALTTEALSQPVRWYSVFQPKLRLGPGFRYVFHPTNRLKRGVSYIGSRNGDGDQPR